MTNWRSGDGQMQGTCDNEEMDENTSHGNGGQGGETSVRECIDGVDDDKSQVNREGAATPASGTAGGVEKEEQTRSLDF